MEFSRNEFLKLMGLGAVAAPVSLLESDAEAAECIRGDVSINVIISSNYRPPTDQSSQKRLIEATLDFVGDYNHGEKLPLWEGKKFEEVDLEVRLKNIIYWTAIGIEKEKSTYPVDPAWIISQIMVESFFNEFAVSPALAVGTCQFIAPTARGYGLLCAGDDSKHSRAPYKLFQDSEEEKEYQKLRKERQKFKKRKKPGKQLSSLDALKIISSGRTISAVNLKTARENLKYQEKLDDFKRGINDARDKYRSFVRANLRGRDIFNDSDAIFLRGFDDRVLYRKTIPAMVKMMAGHLRSRNGNILAAAAGYNAGLSRTASWGLYKPFGRIPDISETAGYISKILVNHFAITKRL